MRRPVLSLLLALSVAGAAQVSGAQPASVAPGPNDAVVYFVRPQAVGLAINFWAFVDQQPLGFTKGNQHLVAVVPAGEHVLWSRSGNVSSLKMTLEAGQTYYIQQQVRMGGLRARVNLELLDAAAGREAVDETKPGNDRDEGDERGGEFAAAEYQEAVANARVP